MRIRFFSRSPSQMQSLSSPRCNERQLWKQTLHLLYLILHHKYVHSNASLLSSNSGPPFYLSCSRPSLRIFLTTTVFDCLSLIRFLQLPEFNLMTVLVDPMPSHFYQNPAPMNDYGYDVFASSPLQSHLRWMLDTTIRTKICTTTIRMYVPLRASYARRWAAKQRTP